MWSPTLFSIRGIRIKLHATFAILVAVGALEWGMAHGWKGALFGAAFIVALFACVLVHELAHSFVAQGFGIKVREILLLPIGGVARLAGRPQSPKQEIAIAVAGPCVNVVLALGLGAGLWFSGPAAGLAGATVAKLAPTWQTFLLLLTLGNASLALFNLLPFFPLDGGRVLRALLSMRWGEVSATRWAAGIGQVASVGMVGFALATGQLLLGLIGLVLFLAATRERQTVRHHPALAALSAADVAEVPAVELAATARIGETVPQLLRTVQDAFPVVHDGALLGVVLRRDLLLAARRPELALQSLRSLAQPVPELPAELSAAEALVILSNLEAPLGVVTTPSYPVGFISESLVFGKLAQLPPTWPQMPPLRPAVTPHVSPEPPRNPA